MRRVAVGLLHHPMLSRHGEALTTTLTSIDVHDIARAVRTYGLHAFYVIHPLPSQRQLAERIRRHWTEGGGGQRIPERAVALGVLRVVADVDAACRDLGPGAERWTTAASDRRGDAVDFDAARRRLAADGPPVLLCFGTGWGMTPAFIDAADVRLAPIRAAQDSGYNHLSVRAAAAVVLDRLFGQPDPG